MTAITLFEKRGDIAHFVFNRPQARNALTFEMYEHLYEATLRVNEDKAVKALVISGAGGKAFAAGTDIAEFRALNSDQDCIDYEIKIERILSALERCRVPTLAAIAGACTGGGAAIAACCDLRLAGSDAKFGFPIARTLGNCLSVANYGRLVHLIGAARVKDLIFTARLIDAEEAKIFGFVGEIVAPDALMTRAEELAKTVAGHAPLTLAATKQALLRLRPPMETGEDLVVMCYRSKDFQEGMEAFLAKRPPIWRGE
ncbi:enoyl-CoA hydratase [Rhodoblastus sphagnicola]|uniref:Enoyl-CoA hydratase n=1 Tax=Rhodoblastus sphagnicola TaxID=333368 RepID=A0A2S6MVL3_9HYPH|nr:enoyl-CoA hydratase [Rhodoblastus sphagnicola]MBB4197516.1 enoyl-CoA hydratase/carnithine racemase [Rhodoblastus sphagnicola]PPQ26389.1 enoyl-CoA hydratase [Rhodoblastus sphagnicola]